MVKIGTLFGKSLYLTSFGQLWRYSEKVLARTGGQECILTKIIGPKTALARGKLALLTLFLDHIWGTFGSTFLSKIGVFGSHLFGSKGSLDLFPHNSPVLTLK